MTEQPVSKTGGYRTLVFFSAFACLMFELVIARVADFHLGFRNSYLAIPITFFGLALGSLHVHFRRRSIERFSVSRSLVLVLLTSSVTFFVVYLLFTQYSSVIAAGAYNDYLDSLLKKTIIFVAVFIVPFYVFGRILTVCYQIKREEIGKIYSADFFGAALGCFLTPVLFHFISLPEIITLLIAVMFLVTVGQLHRTPKRTAALLAAGAALLAGFYALISYMERDIHYAYYPEAEGLETHEITSRWNEFSRVQLVRFERENGSGWYKIIHDNARSNVHVQPYVPGRTRTPQVLDAMELPLIARGRPEDILVMFAGCGAEMVEYHEYTGGQAHITGVEINRLCPVLAAETPELQDYRLAEFYALPNIDLQIAEGRSFLMRNDRKYDLIYVGSSAPTSLAVTGHTRKFLYTKEAFHLYLDALKPGGIMVFDHQPVQQKLETLRQVFAERGIENFAQCIILLASRHGRYSGGTNDIAVAPDGFTAADINRLATFRPDSGRLLRYAPFRASDRSHPVVSRIFDPLDPQAKEIVDDRPYVLDLDFANYSLFPEEELLHDDVYYLSWIKITTLIIVCAAAAVFIVLANLARGRRLPPSILVYLLLTGFCYMLVQVAYIAKLELFLQNPLVSMAAVVSIFLLTSGLGSLTFRRVAGRIGMRLFPFMVAAIVGASVFLLEFMLSHLLGLPLGMKLVLAAAAIAPAGICLGMFYPYAVSRLVGHGRDSSVAITYGISTLSSVIGATYAMSMMLEFGFNALLLQGVFMYAALGVLVVLYGAAARENMLA